MPLRLSLIVILAALPACTESLGHCEQSVLPTCDPHEADCQLALHEHVGCARGVTVAAEAPEFEFLSESEFAARFSALPEPNSDMVRCLRLANLWPKDPILDGLTAGARFDPLFRRVFVADAEDTTAILAAIVQAQRDAELGGVNTWRSDAVTFDERSAFDALFAGEARLFADIAALKTTARDDEEFRKFVRNRLGGYEEAETEFYSYVRSTQYDYRHVGLHFDAFAASFALEGFLAGDPSELEDAYARPLRASAELVRGRLADAAPAEPKAAPPLPSGYTRRVSDRLGAWMYFTFLTRIDPLEAPGPNPWDPQVDATPQRFADVAGKWAGDRFDCTIDDISGNALVIWDIAYDPNVELAPFQVTRATPGYWEYVEREDGLTLIGGDDPEVVTQLAASL